MAIRQVRQIGDEVLTKVCRPITEINSKISELAKDMLDTMYKAEGVGLAAPQVGILKRIVVIDIGEGAYIMINPHITSTEGEVESTEGCLSVLGRQGKVLRPTKVTVKYTDLNNEEMELEGEGLLAVAICHELDHLDGVLYVDKMIEEVFAEEDN